MPIKSIIYNFKEDTRVWIIQNKPTLDVKRAFYISIIFVFK